MPGVSSVVQAPGTGRQRTLGAFAKAFCQWTLQSQAGPLVRAVSSPQAAPPWPAVWKSKWALDRGMRATNCLPSESFSTTENKVFLRATMQINEQTFESPRRRNCNLNTCSFPWSHILESLLMAWQASCLLY